MEEFELKAIPISIRHAMAMIRPNSNQPSFPFPSKSLSLFSAISAISAVN